MQASQELDDAEADVVPSPAIGLPRIAETNDQATGLRRTQDGS